MADEVLMNVLNSANNLLKVKLGLVFSDFVILDELIELTLRGQLHDDENVIGGIENLIEFNYVGMVDEFQYFNLPFYL
jgi:hypothetical protein